MRIIRIFTYLHSVGSLESFGHAVFLNPLNCQGAEAEEGGWDAIPFQMNL